MRGKNTIIINGQQYDAVTGLPTKATIATPRGIIQDFAPSKHTPRHIPVHPSVHRTAAPKKSSPLQHSKTLRREALRRPAGLHEATIARTQREHVVVGKSPAISRFASHPQPITRVVPIKPSATPVKTPAIVRGVHTRLAPPTKAQKPAALSSRQLKELLITQKLAAVDHQKTADKKTHFHLLTNPRTSSVVAACFALVILGGYLTYLNMPNLSIRVAAAQAGINAKFPDYRPDGYRFDGPIAYAPGEVTVKFHANGSKQAYQIKQQNSSWDSVAVLDNYVAKNFKSHDTYSEQGLTIYTSQNKAAWVNGGIFYTIDGDAPLSNEQIQHIAASM